MHQSGSTDYGFLVSDLKKIDMDIQKRCPLCGGPNGCAVAEGRSADECWCQAPKIPQALLKEVAVELRDKTCVCHSCVIAYSQSRELNEGSE